MSDKRAKKNIKKVGVMKGERGAVVPSVDKARGRSRGKLATSIKPASGNTGAGIKKKPVKKYSKGCKISKGYMPDLTIISISAKKRKKKK